MLATRQRVYAATFDWLMRRTVNRKYLSETGKESDIFLIVSYKAKWHGRGSQHTTPPIQNRCILHAARTWNDQRTALWDESFAPTNHESRHLQNRTAFSQAEVSTSATTALPQALILMVFLLALVYAPESCTTSVFSSATGLLPTSYCHCLLTPSLIPDFEGSDWSVFWVLFPNLTFSSGLTSGQLRHNSKSHCWRMWGFSARRLTEYLTHDFHLYKNGRLKIISSPTPQLCKSYSPAVDRSTISRPAISVDTQRLTSRYVTLTHHLVVIGVIWILSEYYQNIFIAFIALVFVIWWEPRCVAHDVLANRIHKIA